MTERGVELVGYMADKLPLSCHLLVQTAGHGAQRPAQAAYFILPGGIDRQGGSVSGVTFCGDALGIIGHGQERPRQMPQERNPPDAGQAENASRHGQNQLEIEEKSLSREVVGLHGQQQIMRLMAGVGDEKRASVPVAGGTAQTCENGRRSGGESCFRLICFVVLEDL